MHLAEAASNDSMHAHSMRHTLYAPPPITNIVKPSWGHLTHLWPTDWQTDTTNIGNNSLHHKHSMQPKNWKVCVCSVLIWWSWSKLVKNSKALRYWMVTELKCELDAFRRCISGKNWQSTAFNSYTTNLKKIANETVDKPSHNSSFDRKLQESGHTDTAQYSQMLGLKSCLHPTDLT